MADRAISDLVAATQVGTSDLFVLEQSNTAKKLTGQILEEWLLELADGHGGISSIAKTGTSGLVDTYTITYADGGTSTFTVTNGNGVISITGPSTAGLVDTYTIHYGDGESAPFAVTNGKGIASIAKTGTSGLVDTYTVAYNDGSTSTFTVANGKGIASIAKTGTSGLVDTYTVTYNDGSTSTFTVANGNGITDITVSTDGLTTTYTLQLGDGSTYEIPVSDGRGITGITWGTSGAAGDGQIHTGTIAYNDGTTSAIVFRDGLKGDTGDMSYVWIKWAAAQPTDDIDMLDVPAAWIGIYAGTADAAPTAYTDYAWYQYRGDDGTNIASIALTSSAGLADTYTVTLTDGTTSTFTVTNGNGIESITGPASSGLEDTYTITMTDGSISEFTVTNGNGIASIAKTGTSGLVDTYTVMMTDGSTSTFNVANGNGIASIAKTGTSGLVDTYTVTMTDGGTSTFNVANGKGIASIAMTSGSHAAGTTDTYTITFTDGDTTTFSVYNGANGTGSVSSVAGIQAVGGDVPLILTGNGPPTSATVGQENQLYFDYNAGTLYICLGESGGAYNWSSTTLTVDSSLSTSSTNPVENAAITGKVGTVPLNTTASNLSEAVNELLAGIPGASTTLPSMDGTASHGVGTTWARADHVHPSDTSKANVADIPAALSELSNDIGAMRYLGVNPIASAAEDTPESWAALGSGYAFFNTGGLLNGQPYRYGMLVSYVQAGASSMTQWFIPFGNNIPCIRASTSGGWYGNGWRELAEASAVLPAQPSPETITFSGYRAVAQGYASTSTNANVFMPMPNNASGAEVVRTGTWTLGTPSQASAAISGLAVTQVTRAGIYLAATTTGLTTGEPATLKCVTNATMTITWS